MGQAGRPQRACVLNSGFDSCDGGLVITVAPAPPSPTRAHPGPAQFDAFLGAKHLCRSWTPLLAGARVLLADGVAPNTVLHMRHTGSDMVALSSTVGAAAGLTVHEGHTPPRFTRFQSIDGRQEQARSVRCPVEQNVTS
jgi:hypothetical protein